MADPRQVDLNKLEQQLAADGGAKGKAPVGTAAGSAKNRKKAQPAKPELLWTVKVERIYVRLRAHFLMIIEGLRSPDRPTRRMSAGFLLSLVAALVVFGLAFGRFYAWRRTQKVVLSSSEETSRQMGEFFRKQAEEAKTRTSLVNLGTFTVSLKDIEGQGTVKGVMNMAELEIVLECDSRETRIFVEENLAQARNQLTNVFTTVDREDLLSRAGKKKMKKRLLEKLNLWLPKGKVEDLFFSKLVVS